MKLGLLLNDPQEEHDCFSDNTHNSHFYGGLGIRNVYLGRYVRADGSVVEEPSVSALLTEADAEADARLRESLNDAMASLTAIKTAAEAGTADDQLLAPGDAAGEALIQAAIDALVAQTRDIERAVAVLQLEPIAFEGSDRPDKPGTVFQWRVCRGHARCGWPGCGAALSADRAGRSARSCVHGPPGDGARRRGSQVTRQGVAT